MDTSTKMWEAYLKYMAHLQSERDQLRVDLQKEKEANESMKLELNNELERVKSFAQELATIVWKYIGPENTAEHKDRDQTGKFKI
jgi:hypothetical protein